MVRRPDLNRRARLALVIIAVLSAATSASMRWTLGMFATTVSTYLLVGAGLAIIWLASTAALIAAGCRRSLWLLLLAPAALLWPAAFCLLLWSCHHGGDCT
jgi:hypothetical protein